MAANSYVADSRATASTGVRPTPPGISAQHAALLARLMQWFGVEFHLVDGVTGDLLHCALDQTAREWGMRGQLCRVVATNGKVAFIEDDEPLLVLAIPFCPDDGPSVVAVGTFVTANSASGLQLSRAADLLGLETQDCAEWIRRQTCWTPDALLRLGHLAALQLLADGRLKSLEQEVRSLSLHLAANYEEISLLYQLTQNLKLSSKADELATLAVEWLAEVLPAESFAIQLMPKAGATNAASPAEPTLITCGPCPLSNEDLAEIIEQFEMTPGKRPLIVNRRTTQLPSWRWPEARELIMVPLAEGANCFGWLVACNHSSDGEFGTVEASLLSSVGAILGIHSGNSELYQQQREFFAGVVRALTSAIDAKDPYTCGHSDRVARVSVRLAEELGCNRKQVDTIYLSGLLHDVGKIGIDDNVLRKPGKLTEAEYEHIKTHAEIGFKILKDIQQLDDVLPVVLHHHEQWDGKGYPHGLAGESIPQLARIVAVADSFDAMGSDRPYRKGMCEEKLDCILRDGAGKQWDAAVIEAYFRARDAIREIANQKVNSVTLDVREWT
jgi:putative nucleotidyltransferase with HDIG domain